MMMIVAQNGSSEIWLLFSMLTGCLVNSENAPPGKNKSVRKSNRRALGDISNDGIR